MLEREAKTLRSNDGSIVTAQRWKDLPWLRLGSWTPELSVTVVIPARDCQAELDRTLAALSSQTYPPELLDVVVVDDASEPPLTLPEVRPSRSVMMRVDQAQAQAHGSGRARHAGAKRARGDIVLFLDADMMADPRHVEAHARWHHVCSHAVVLGRKWFVDVQGIAPVEVAEAAARDELAALLDGRPKARHVWQEDFIRSQDDLTQDTDDCFLAVVGATVSIRRDLYSSVGGFAEFGLRGIVDTEFGYRAFTGGAVIVPDDEALAFHQGRRNFASRGDEIKLARTGLAANRLPIPLFRPSNTGRQWAVPMVRVIVDAGEVDPVLVQVTTDSVLASGFTDVAVTVVADQEHTLPQWVRDYFAHDQRVSFVDEPVESGFPSPFSAAVPAGLSLAPETLERALEDLWENGGGVVRTHPDALGGRSFEVWRTRALRRSTMSSSDTPDLDRRASLLFGERWVHPTSLGVREAQHRITRQGMIAGDPSPAPASPASAAPIADRAVTR